MAKNTAKKEEVFAYDQVPYESFAYPQTHPYNLYTAATLFKMQPAPFEKAKVLELGCASGVNLVPLALAFPKAKFFGIDMSQEQIDEANRMKDELGVDNLEFAQQNILDFKPKRKTDKYDYIICHGIFSWVPEDVREAIFDLCNNHLADNGVAIVSYNTLPGWNSVRSLREMMLYHAKRFNTPIEKVAQSKHLLSFLAENVNENNAGYKSIIENEMKLLNQTNASYLYHDHLENENTQFYLSDFVSMARGKGLEYVGDSNVNSMYLGNMPKDAMEKLQALNDVVSQEQYMDFISNRRFRSSILCKQGNKIDRNIQKEQILDYHLSFAHAVEVSQDDKLGKTTFKVGNATLDTSDKILTALLLKLTENPAKPLAVKDLVKSVQEDLKIKDKKEVEASIVSTGINLVLRGFLSLGSYSPEFSLEISDKPEAYKLARYEAKLNNYSRRKLTNLTSQTVNTDVVTNILVAELDGSKTISELIDIMIEKNKEGLVRIDKDGEPLTDKGEVKRVVTELVNKLLPKLAARGFLVA